MMADSHIRLTVTVRDLVSTKLLLLQLHMLHDRMRVGASPFADDLGRILERFEEREEADDRLEDDE